MTRGAVRALMITTLTLAPLLSPSIASAGTVSRSGNAVTVTGGDEVNDFDILVSGDDLLIVDHAGALGAGPGCVQGNAQTATCGDSDTVTSVTVSAGGGNDDVRVVWPFDAASHPQVNMLLGPGHDLAIGGQGTSIISGQGGNDQIGGEHPCCGDPLEAGDDEFHGGPGNDLLLGGEGNDLLNGGDGIDTADFAPTGGDNAPAVTVDLVAGTAVGNGSDTLVAIEDVIGSAKPDVILGDDGPNTLEGRSGEDVLEGRAGGDRLLGGPSNDVLRGGPGNDQLAGGQGRDRVDFSRGGAGAVRVDLPRHTARGHGSDRLSSIEDVVGTRHRDRIRGSSARNQLFGRGGADVINGRGGVDLLRGDAGGDVLIGGPGFDSLRGNAGNDDIRSRDGRRDRISGGPGRDLAVTDPLDVVRGVEQRR